MLTQEEKLNKVLQQVGFVPTSQAKIAELLKDEVTNTELYMILSTLVADNKIQTSMGPKGPEFSRKWNSAIDEERKQLSKELNTRFDEKTIFLPRYEGYVANIRDNFVNGCACDLKKGYSEVSDEYFLWHRNAKTNNVYPPKMNALNSSSVMACNVVKALEVQPEQVQYAVEFQVIASEPLRDHPEELSSPKAFFDAMISYSDAVEFIQGSFLEPFYQPFRQSMWAYQYGNRYLFDDENAIYLWRQFAAKANYVFFDGYKAMKSMLAVYSDILANPDDYKGKKVSVLNVNWNISADSKYKNLKEFFAQYDEEGKACEEKLNSFLATLPLPEGTSLEFEYLTLEEVADKLGDSAKDYLTKRYLGF